MTYNEKVGKNLIVKARQTDLVHFLRSRHPKSLQYAAHPDKPGKFCWRGTVHDSITFFPRITTGLTYGSITAGLTGRVEMGLTT